MTVDELRIAIEFRRFGPLAATELADALGDPWQAQSALLRMMERRGLVQRVDPAAGLWDLTERGGEVVDA